MATITLKEIRAAGMSMAEFARRSQVPYNRLWRDASGGYRLAPDEIERVQAVLEAARSQP